jgi:peroxiredoxin Q/BCP
LLKKDENVKLYAISIDPPDVNRGFAQKIESDGKGKVSFPLLSDPDHKIIDAYGLRDPAYEGQKVYGIPHPAVYVINKDGKVTWAKVESDYRRRPTNQEIRSALEALR